MHFMAAKGYGSPHEQMRLDPQEDDIIALAVDVSAFEAGLEEERRAYQEK